MTTTAKEITQTLFDLSDPLKKEFLPHFFKTGKGEYGEGDLFIGVVVPRQREVVKAIDEISFNEIEKLLDSPYHECRLTALLYLVKYYKQMRKHPQKQESVYQLYCQNYKSINNWDLVDLSAPGIMGTHLLTRPRKILSQYAKSGHLWKQRISIVSTYTFIKADDYSTTLELAEILENHSHDLIQKAVGWMLREVGKRNFDAEYEFLIKNDRYKQLPRTLLRYAIEKFEENLRQEFLKGKR